MRHPVRRGSYFQVGVHARLPNTWDAVRNGIAQVARVPALTTAFPSGGYYHCRFLLRSRTKSTRITWFFLFFARADNARRERQSATAARIFELADIRISRRERILVRGYIHSLELIHCD